jgi:hypothetical protein
MKVWMKKAGAVVDFVDGSFRLGEDGEWLVDVVYDGYNKPTTGVRYSDLAEFDPFQLPQPPQADHDKENKDNTSPPRKESKAVAEKLRRAASTDSYVENVSPPKTTPNTAPASSRRESSVSYCEIISPPRAVKMPTGPTVQISDDIEEIGVANEHTYIHARFDCPKFEFEASRLFSHWNQQCCDKCFCWVCDVPAVECSIWSVHCSADGKRKAWIDQRAKRRNGQVKQK